MHRAAGLVSMSKKKKTMMDLIEQIGDDPRFRSTMEVLHSTSGPFSENAKKTEEARITDEQTNRPSDRQTVGPSDQQTVIPSVRQTVRPTDGMTVRPSDYQTIRPADRQTNILSDCQTVRPSDRVSDKQAAPQDVLSLPINQACILEYLITKPQEGFTCYREIHEATNITISPARDAIMRLTRKGFMQKLTTIRKPVQGFLYSLNKSLCDHFIRIGGLEYIKSLQQTVRLSDCQTGRLADHQTGILSDRQTDRLTNGLTAHSSSSTIEIKTTTKAPPKKDAPNDDAFVLVGPEMLYWIESGMQERQALKWCDEFDVKPVELRRQLAYARWDLVENNKEKDIRTNAISWVYGCLKKTACCYTPPDNYLSPAERRAKELKIARDKEEQAQREIRSMEIEDKFRKIMSEPEGPEYKELYDQLSDFEKKLVKGSKILEATLRAKYFALQNS